MVYGQIGDSTSRVRGEADRCGKRKNQFNHKLYEGEGVERLEIVFIVKL